MTMDEVYRRACVRYPEILISKCSYSNLMGSIQMSEWEISHSIPLIPPPSLPSCNIKALIGHLKHIAMRITFSQISTLNLLDFIKMAKDEVREMSESTCGPKMKRGRG